jgi:endogenous inhibitor of DNA gyrase (YacG/DUF329 family)
MLDKDTLSSLVSQGLSQHAIGKFLHCGQTTVCRYLLKYDLKTIQTGRTGIKICSICQEKFKPHSSKQPFCSGKCHQESRYQAFIQAWLAGTCNGNRPKDESMSHYIRRWLLRQHGEKCWSCGWNQKHPDSDKCPLEVDHIDGNHTNNRPDNLRILCPNCHSLTSTYKGRNKGHGRFSRRQRYANGQSF